MRCSPYDLSAYQYCHSIRSKKYVMARSTDFIQDKKYKHNDKDRPHLHVKMQLSLFIKYNVY